MRALKAQRDERLSQALVWFQYKEQETGKLFSLSHNAKSFTGEISKDFPCPVTLVQRRPAIGQGKGRRS